MNSKRKKNGKIKNILYLSFNEKFNATFGWDRCFGYLHSSIHKQNVLCRGYKINELNLKNEMKLFIYLLLFIYYFSLLPVECFFILLLNFYLFFFCLSTFLLFHCVVTSVIVFFSSTLLLLLLLIVHLVVGIT